MKHYGNICKINGAEVEPADVMIGGSPCQDLSVAGKRAGLDGERSGLFMEQIRIIKEMRDATNGINPRYMVWENVPGAFSSNKGEDFRVVLEETAKIADETAVIPQPAKGKWANAGAIMGDGWSIAWRVFDAQFWGVPQRRRRIALVADFGGQSASEILFEREGVSWDIAESGAAGEGIAGDVERSTDAAVGFDSYNQVTYSECSQTLKAEQGGDSVAKVIVSKACYQNGQGDCFENDVTCAIATNSNPSGRNVPLITESVCMPINTQVITRHNALGNGTGFGLGKDGDPAYTIQAGHEHGVAVFSFDSLSSNSMKSSNPHSGCRQVEIAKCIDTTNPDPSKNQGGMAVVHDARGNGDGKKQYVFENHSQDTRYVGPLDVAPIVSATFGMGGNNQPFVVKELDTYSFQRSDELKESQVASTQSARQYKSPTDLVAAVLAEETGPVAFACNQRDEVRDLHDVSAAIQAQPGMKQQTFVAAVDCRNGTENPDINGTLQAKPNGGTSYNLQNTVRTHQSVRRLTPLECERLQGFPDNWTNIPPQANVTAEDLAFWRVVWDEWQTMNEKKLKTDKQIIKWLQSEPADSARYKALGNSIALPPWRFVLSRIHKQGARTMASLFDGIGGFPKVWNELGGQTLWASEVEPFPIAVTRYQFKEVHNA